MLLRLLRDDAGLIGTKEGCAKVSVGLHRFPGRVCCVSCLVPAVITEPRS
jgi:hypothetical protein